MSIFGFYFITTILRQAGWPRRRGLFNSEAVVDTLTADAAIDQMVDWSAALGACRPRLALQVIAWMFYDRDWDGENAPRILNFINEVKNVWDASDNKAPHDIVKSFKLSKQFGKMIRSKDLKNNHIRTALEEICLEGLLWGLANPDRFKTWYELREKSQRDRLPLMQNAGLAIDSIPTLSEFLKESEEMLKGYESEVDPLPTIPQRLLADARALGREINN
jgi:hypothetical protein